MDPPGTAISPYAMVGRQAQTAVLEELLDGLSLGRPSALMLAGEAGIGKTRLADELVNRARSRGWRTVWVAAWQGDGVPPLWPWAELLRQVVGTADVLDRQAPDADPASASSARFEQFEAVTAALRAAIGGAPLVVVLDDAHWADPASLQLAAFASAALRDQPLLLVVTYRPYEIDRAGLETLTRLGVTLALPPLTVDAVGDLLAGVVGQEVPSRVVAAIAERSNGNPLFVQEFARLLAISGRTTVAPNGVPDGIVAVIERRLARLPESAVELLHVGAVIGQVFTTEAVSAIAAVRPNVVASRLEPAVAAGVLARSTTGYVFAHDLIRQVALVSISVDRRTALHRAAAEHHRNRLVADSTRHAAIADHLAHAGPEHAREASVHWVAAAHGALTRLAYEEAAACFRRARQLDADEPAHECRLLLDEGAALMRAGTLVDARGCFEEAAHTARSCGRFDLLAEAGLGLGVGGSGWEVPISDAHQIELVREALDALPPEDKRLRSMLLARLSVAAATPESMEDSRRLAEEALVLARDVDDPRLVAQALGSLCDALGGPEHAPIRAEHGRAIVELAAHAHDRVLELLGHRFLVVALLELGRFEDLDWEIAVFERLARQVNQPLLGWYAPLFRGMRALLAGDLDEAERRQHEVADAAVVTGSVNADLLAATLLVGIDVARGRPASDAFVLPYDIDPVVWASYGAGLAFVALTRGESAEAARLLRMHANNGFAHVGNDAEHLATIMMFARVAVATGDLGAVRHAARMMEPFAGRWIVDGIAAVCWGPVDLELARFAAAVGDREVLERHRANARVLLARIAAPRLTAELESFAVSDLERAPGASRPRAAAGETIADLIPNSLRQEGDYWSLTFGGITTRMRDAKGLHDIRRLVARPGTEIHVLDLMAASRFPAEKAPTKGAHMGRAHTTTAQGDVGAVIDDTARAQYVRRLRDLQEDLDDAEAANDLGRAEQLQTEYDFLVDELGSAMGLGGRTRRAGGDGERARKAVGTRIRLTIDRMGATHPSLARHLRNAMQTGVYCEYRPERPTEWDTGT